MRTLTMTILLFAFPLLAHSAVIEVPKDYPTIQAAIDAAVNGDTVLVAPGTYVENIDFKGKAITVSSSGGTTVTVIDGNQFGSVVTFENSEGLNTVLQGFTLSNGIGNDNYFPGCCNSVGGGIFCISSSPTITHNTISGNYAHSAGGIFCYDYSSPIIANNIISGNSAMVVAAGIYCRDNSSPTITNNIFTGNSGDSIFCIGKSSPAITNNTITGNSGGGIYCQESISIISNNTISGNTNGCGIECVYNAFPIITNNTISGNEDGGISCLISSSPSITNTIIWENNATEIYWDGSGNPTFAYCDIKGGWPGTGNINSDPLFVDPYSNDFHLTYPSPCKDSGDNAVTSKLFDFEGDPRIANGTVDMGADEFYTHLYCTGDATPGGTIALNFIDIPNKTPVFLWIGSGVLDPPFHSKKYGDWYLQPPVLIDMFLGAIPQPNGVLSFSYTFDPTFPTIDIPMQALIGKKLTNLCVMPVK